MISNIIYLSIILIGGILGLLNFKTCKISFQLLTILLLTTFVSEITATILQYSNGNNSLPQKLYTPIHIALFSCIYYTLVTNNTVKKIIAILGFLLFVVSVIFISFSKAELPSFIIMSDSIMLVIFSILYFFEMITNPTEEHILKSGNFWLNTSVIIYFTGSFIYWATFNYLLHHNKNILIELSYIFNNFFDPLHYLLLGIALYLHIRIRKINLSSK